MKELLEKYSLFLKSREKSQTYHNYMRVFLSYLEEKNIDMNTITQQVITDFFNVGQKQKSGQPYSKNSKNSFARAGRDFYTYFLQKVDNEFLKVKNITPDEKMHKFFRYEDLEKGIKYICSNDTGLINPDKADAILSFLFATGLSKAEFLALKRSDIDLSSEKSSVKTFREKTDKERYVFFSDKYSPRLKQKLIRYFDDEKEDINAFNITQPQLDYLVHKFGSYIGMEVTPHMFRHSFAMYILKKTGNIKLVQTLLGHASPLTTAVYTKMDKSSIMEYF